MHFSGLAGMPRRIPDYPDTFLFWNIISSFGSLISFLGVLIFLYTIYDAFVSDDVKFKFITKFTRRSILQNFILPQKFSKLLAFLMKVLTWVLKKMANFINII